MEKKKNKKHLIFNSTDKNPKKRRNKEVIPISRWRACSKRYPKSRMVSNRSSLRRSKRLLLINLTINPSARRSTSRIGKENDSLIPLWKMFRAYTMEAYSLPQMIRSFTRTSLRLFYSVWKRTDISMLTQVLLAGKMALPTSTPLMKRLTGWSVATVIGRGWFRIQRLF